MTLRKILLVLAVLFLVAGAVAYTAYLSLGRTPDELLRYAERRLVGHRILETVFLPAIRWTRQYVDVPITAPAVCTGSTAPKMHSTVPAVATDAMGRAKSTIRVGPQHEITRVAEAARRAKDGDVVEIEAGIYLNDVASWRQNNLTIRAVGGRARIEVSGRSAEGKAIWVIKGNNVTVENMEFAGARVPDRNGAGIRHEGGNLTVRNSLFEHNEMGLLTANIAKAVLEVEGSEFCGNRGDEAHKLTDPGHQIYVGTIRRFVLRDSYVHQGAFGHLVKSRARENHITYNRMTDEYGGRASYELEFPNGGIAYVIGNIIQQAPASDDPAVVRMGAEGYRWPRNELYLVHNTLVDDRPRGGRFLQVREGAHRIVALNNLLVGESKLDAARQGDYIANHHVNWSHIAAPLTYDYRLKPGSNLIGKVTEIGVANGVTLRPQRQYVHPRKSEPLRAPALLPGALQEFAS